YLIWIHGHNGLFLGYRILLILAFALILTLPFSLYRIIVAQEIVGQQEHTANNTVEEEAEDTQSEDEPTLVTTTDNGMPAFAWRGKGFVVLAAWLGTAGLALYVLGTIISTFYLTISSADVTSGTEVADSTISLSGTLTIISNTVGIGLL